MLLVRSLWLCQTVLYLLYDLFLYIHCIFACIFMAALISDIAVFVLKRNVKLQLTYAPPPA